MISNNGFIEPGREECFLSSLLDTPRFPSVFQSTSTWKEGKSLVGPIEVFLSKTGAPSLVRREFPDIPMSIGCSCLFPNLNWRGGGRKRLSFLPVWQAVALRLLLLSFWAHRNSQGKDLKSFVHPRPLLLSSSFPCKSVSGYRSWRAG